MLDVLPLGGIGLALAGGGIGPVFFCLIHGGPLSSSLLGETSERAPGFRQFVATKVPRSPGTQSAPNRVITHPSRCAASIALCSNTRFFAQVGSPRKLIGHVVRREAADAPLRFGFSRTLSEI